MTDDEKLALWRSNFNNNSAHVLDKHLIYGFCKMVKVLGSAAELRRCSGAAMRLAATERRPSSRRRGLQRRRGRLLRNGTAVLAVVAALCGDGLGDGQWAKAVGLKFLGATAVGD
nr:hypothetical protein Iba_chr13aCG10120 [Ipomoea batatas]